MKAFGAMVVAVLLGSTFAGAANAVELRNYDSRNHTVKITSPSWKRDVEFRAGTLSLVICVDKCKFEVVGVGTVTATRDDIVTIEEGKVTATKVPLKK